MSVDLHRIRTGISSGSSRNGFGNIVSFPSASGFPAAGSLNYTMLDVDYPVAQGGLDFSMSIDGVAYTFTTQNADIPVRNDGSGGTYIDGSTAYNIHYKPYGISFATETDDVNLDISTNCSGTVNVFNGTSTTSYHHNGAGSYYTGTAFNYSSVGTTIYTESCPYEDAVTIIYYYISDGSGGYTVSQS